MTITSTINRVSLSGTGESTYTYPYRFLQPSDLVVILRTNATKVDVVQTLGTHYNVTGEGDAGGGSVIFDIIEDGEPTSAETVIIYNDPGITQGTDYIAGGILSAEALEQNLDLLTLQQQRTRSMAERTPRLLEGDTDGSGGYSASGYKIRDLNLTPTATSDATSKNYVDSQITARILAGAGAITTSDSYVTATDYDGSASVTARKIGERWGEVFNVRDYGAVGNGTADDQEKIEAAVDAAAAAGGGVVYFPETTFYYEVGSVISTTLGGPTLFLGETATLKADAASIFSKMLNITTAGHDCSIVGLRFDGNSDVNECVRVTEANQDQSKLLVRDCSFTNSYSSDTTYNTGFQALGGWDHVTIDNSSFTDHTRADVDGATTGCTVAKSGSVLPRFTTVQNCHFENILNGSTTTDVENKNSDGLKIFGGNVGGGEEGETYVFSSATVSNNSFRNCKGRSIKIQNDETTVIGNVFARSILPIKGGFSEVNLQTSSGEVSSNKFHYDEAPSSASPFDDGGAATAGSAAISFYSGTADTRIAMISVTNNLIYNNVGGSTGVLSAVVDVTAAGTKDKHRVVTINGNQFVGKADSFIKASPAADDGNSYISASDNFVEELATSFININGSGDNSKNFVTLTGNIHTGTAVPASWYATEDEIPSANYSISNCVGMVTDTTALGHLKYRSGTTFVSGINNLSPDASAGGIVSIVSASIENGGTWYPPARGFVGHGALRIITANFSHLTTGIFCDASTTGPSVAPSKIAFDTGTAGTFLNFIADGGAESGTKLNIWRYDTADTNATIAIKNNLGTARVVTLVTIG